MDQVLGLRQFADRFTSVQRVSILVLVDHILGLANPEGVFPRSTGFNPCSGGSHPGSKRKFKVARTPDAVSILVLVDHILGPLEVAAQLLGELVSILVLVDHILGLSFLLRSVRDSYCFNPCSGGSHPGSSTNLIELQLADGFQSLFWWITSWVLALNPQ